MESLNSIINSHEINSATVLLRLFVSTAIGTIIGLERETHRQPAGLRTHILICTGSTLLMLISIYIPQVFKNFAGGDPGRIAAQVVSGIGFLGAGAILKMGVNIRGLTTAASIWTISAIGLAIGAGMFNAAIVGTLIVLFVLMIFETFEKKIFKPKNHKRFEITCNKTSQLQDFKDIFSRQRASINIIEMESDAQSGILVWQISVHIYEDERLPEVVKQISALDGVTKVKVTLPNFS